MEGPATKETLSHRTWSLPLVLRNSCHQRNGVGAVICRILIRFSIQYTDMTREHNHQHKPTHEHITAAHGQLI